ncbi:MAG: holo-[acyl-carrier-protein] synthase [Candidatus Infernicultor aquiphilus]|uniref:Holo-[acyl-carrier-protein] synthase n=1 Tax=Candidatus Infernicultor aquiphilus TaxID=1805029 RepID=A0A2M8CFF7_9BACT|nr:MAG: holo-[acyl-carrier-protein] synthase [Candidatus Atribacteria bacterium CG17_big_fil_post_rev_8_21_14_2_50_34_11]PJB57800.1 MAG: holo-[acyl-carrier-protein] synthase [Candidatus Atribacteria bacterium CG_4_9_14_3_um_filter_33_16]
MIFLIIGCGIDLVKIERIEKIIKRWGDNLTSRMFTLLEREYCKKRKSNKYQSYAGKFAAKEALLKALGLGLGGVNWTEIEISNNELGQPIIKTSGKLNIIVSKKGVSKYFLTISHTKDYAVAEVILESSAQKSEENSNK